MPVIAVVNPKGGSGKSTLATHLAGHGASLGLPVMLGDADRQKSTLVWLRKRSTEPLAAKAPIVSWVVDSNKILRPPSNVTHVVLDTPAGLHEKKLHSVLAIADRVLVPLQPSLFDIQATHAFVQELREHKPRMKIAIIGNRVKETTVSADHLRQFLDTLDVPVLALLRDTQLYVQLAARGATLWDVAPSRAERDLAQWQPILDWAK